jgi:hypothetical protein
MQANQLRLYFFSLAYVLMNELRTQALENTEFAKAQCHAIRVKLLKIGAQVRVSVRCITVSLASSYPYQNTFVPGELEKRLSSALLIFHTTGDEGHTVGEVCSQTRAAAIFSLFTT